MKEQVKISKIVLNLNGKDVELTTNQARSLCEKLNELFGKPDKAYVPTPYPVYPIYKPWITWTAEDTQLDLKTYTTCKIDI